MLGLDGFVLLAVSEYAGELEQAIETTAAEVFCRGCGVQARLHDRRPSWVRDLPSGGRPVTLVWGEAGLAVHGEVVPDLDVDRNQPEHPSQGVPDRAGSPRDLSPGG